MPLWATGRAAALGSPRSSTGPSAAPTAGLPPRPAPGSRNVLGGNAARSGVRRSTPRSAASATAHRARRAGPQGQAARLRGDRVLHPARPAHAGLDPAVYEPTRSSGTGSRPNARASCTSVSVAMPRACPRPWSRRASAARQACPTSGPTPFKTLPRGVLRGWVTPSRGPGRHRPGGHIVIGLAWDRWIYGWVPRGKRVRSGRGDRAGPDPDVPLGDRPPHRRTARLACCLPTSPIRSRS